MYITKEFTFEAAHRLLNYEGLCRNIHGHSYKLTVTIAGIVDKQTGMVIDFAELKKIVQEKIISVVDHALILEKEDPARELAQELGVRSVILENAPTAENMLVLFANLLIDSGIGLDGCVLKLYETATSSASLIMGSTK